MLFLCLGVCAAIVAIFGLFSDVDKIAFVHGEHGRDIKGWFYALAGVAVIGLVGAYSIQNAAYYGWRATEAAQAKQQKDKDDRLAAEHQAEVVRLSKTAERVDAAQKVMERRLQHVERKTLADSRVAVLGRTLPTTAHGLTTSTVEAAVLDKDGKQQAYIVVYLFPDAAFWGYQSYSTFQDLSGNAIDLTAALNSDVALAELQKNEQIVAVGLESNTRGGSDVYAWQRATHLCGALYALVAKPNIQTFGVSFGKYSGALEEKNSRQERRQRSVVIVGVKDIVAGLDPRPIVPEILRLVELPGVDMNRYAGASAPRWVTIQECVPPRPGEFMRR